MKALVTADFHLTSRPADNYRWGVFKWLHGLAVEHHVDAVFILGDLTDRKDEHDAALVNRLVNHLVLLKAVARVFLLKGNHDYGADPGCPFFGFLDGLGIPYYRAPAQVKLEDGTVVMFLPHARDPEQEWPHKKHLMGVDAVFFHQALRGAVFESGRACTDGLDPAYFSRATGTVIGGDVHAPQAVGEFVWYVGAPHPVRYGDDFQPRALLLTDGKVKSLPRKDCPRKAVVTVRRAKDLEGLGLRPGDMAKVVYELPRAEYADWPKRRARVVRVAGELGITLGGLTLRELPGEEAPKARARETSVRPEQTLKRWAKSKGLDPEVTKAGLEVLEQE